MTADPQGLSAENRALVEREIDSVNMRIMDAVYSWSLINHLMDAARSEGPQPPAVKVDEGVLEAAVNALERLLHNFTLLLRGKPVRDVAETEAEVRQALSVLGSRHEG